MILLLREFIVVVIIIFKPNRIIKSAWAHLSVDGNRADGISEGATIRAPIGNVIRIRDEKAGKLLIKSIYGIDNCHILQKVRREAPFEHFHEGCMFLP